MTLSNEESADRGTTGSVFRPGPRRFVALAVGVAIAAGLVIIPRVAETPFHGDESGWITSAYHYTDLVAALDVTADHWGCPECTSWGSLNLHLGQWLIGVPLVTDSAIGGRRFSKYYDFSRSLDENAAQGRIPPDEILWRARRAVAVFGVVTCVLLFTVGYVAYGPAVGVLASALLMANPLFLRQATRAMTDVHNAAALLGVCATLMWFGRRARRPMSLRQMSWAGAVVGVVTGLASSVKFTTMVVSGAMFVVASLAWVQGRARWVGAASFVVSVLIVMYGLNPWLWIDPRHIRPHALQGELGRLYHDFESSSFEKMMDGDRFPQLYYLGKLPLMFVRLSRMQNELLKVYPSAHWQGSRFITLHRELLVRYASFQWEWVFLAIGAVSAMPFAKRRSDPVSRDGTRPADVAVLFVVANYFFILAFMKLNWDRYYLPTVVADRLLVAIGLRVVAAEAWSRFRRLGGPRLLRRRERSPRA